MTDDRNSTQAQAGDARRSVNRRREVLRRMGQASLAAGAAAPMAALAGTGKRWCKHPVDTTKCVHASVSGMGSNLMSRNPNDEVCAKKVSHYATSTNWPGTCFGAASTIVCTDTFKKAFNCSGTAVDSGGRAQSNTDCLLNKRLIDLCSMPAYNTSAEAHWVCAMANANKINGSDGKASFPYTPAQVAGFYLSTDLVLKSSAYTFFTTYCENYA